MSNNLLTFFEVTLAFFASIGIVYLFRDMWRLIFKNCEVLSAMVTLDLTSDPFPVQKLIDFASFYHESGANKYIKKIIVISDAKEIRDNITELQMALRLDFELQDFEID